MQTEFGQIYTLGTPNQGVSDYSTLGLGYGMTSPISTVPFQSGIMGQPFGLNQVIPNFTGISSQGFGNLGFGGSFTPATNLWGTNFSPWGVTGLTTGQVNPVLGSLNGMTTRTLPVQAAYPHAGFVSNLRNPFFGTSLGTSGLESAYRGILGNGHGFWGEQLLNPLSIPQTGIGTIPGYGVEAAGLVGTRSLGSVGNYGMGVSAFTNGQVRYYDNDQDIVIEATLPTEDAKAFDVVIIGSEIRIRNTKIGVNNRYQGEFISLPIPPQVDVNHIKASAKHGILTITLPRQQAIVESIRKLKIA